MKKVILIGAGNIAWHLGKRLFEKGYTILQVYSRSLMNAKLLASTLKAEAIDAISAIDAYADYYFLLVPDHVISSMLDLLTLKGGYLIHTSGATDIALLQRIEGKTGVLYPLQTFSKTSPLEFSNIPLLIESGKPEFLNELSIIAKNLSNFVYEVDSNNRLLVHLSAVFANNFTNHLFHIAKELMESKGIPFSIFNPLLRETVEKAIRIGPENAQTGPARRGDESTIQKHLTTLTNFPNYKIFYQLFAQEILKYYGEKLV